MDLKLRSTYIFIVITPIQAFAGLAAFIVAFIFYIHLNTEQEPNSIHIIKLTHLCKTEIPLYWVTMLTNNSFEDK